MNGLRLAVCLLFSSGLVFADGAGLSNQVGNHPSPYLAMHADDPVQWQLWNSRTLQKAGQLNRPILVSIGYFACHWCHVMQRESFQDPLLAEILNTSFIPVKVDRELNPALDAYLIEFVELTRGQAGWPLNVLLTPEGYPLLGVTYLPRDRFNQLLTRFALRWQTQEAQLRKAAESAMQEWRSIRRSDGKAAGTPGSPVKSLLVQANQLMDELDGGFGQQNKFPMVPQVSALMDLGDTPGSGETDAFVKTTLTQMARQGMHDNLGGGFFRYVIDPGWQVPHYEKMLYDNAQLAVLYFKAARAYDNSEYLQVALSTVDYLLREMLQDDAAFISSYSAVDDEGREGYYYQWSDAELSGLLSGSEHQAVMAAWFGARADESEYGRLPRWQAGRRAIAARLGWSIEKLDSELQSARVKLLAARKQRVLPADNKALAAWNGLMLSALAAAYEATGEALYQQHADSLAEYLTSTLWKDQRLLRYAQQTPSSTTASLEDYALVAQGLWQWGKQRRQAGAADRAMAEKLVRIAWERYYVDGRWRLTDAPLVPMLQGRLALSDGALPSATAVISRLSAEHPGLRKDKSIQALLGGHLDAVAAGLNEEIFWYASYVELLNEYQR